MRLNRYLSAAGAASRRKGEDIIRAGRVCVNGAVVDDPAHPIEPGLDAVTLDGQPLTVGTKKRWYLLNKPADVLVSRGDTHGRSTVYDLLGDETRGVFAVGRLDIDTTGVLLFTDDGDMAHRLTHPSFGVRKVYRAEVNGVVGPEAVAQVEQGVMLDDGPSAPARMRILRRGKETSMVELTLREGRNREVKRILMAVGHRVRNLERLSFGGLGYSGVPVGSYRPLRQDELARLMGAVTPTPPKDAP